MPGGAREDSVIPVLGFCRPNGGPKAIRCSILGVPRDAREDSVIPVLGAMRCSILGVPEGAREDSVIPVLGVCRPNGGP